MLYYDTIDVSEVIDAIKTSAPGLRYLPLLIFLDKWFRYQPCVCNECHDVLMMFINLNDIAVLNIPSADYRCIINRICKSDAVNLLQNVHLTKKRGIP